MSSQSNNKDQSFVRIELTPNQQAQVLAQTGKQADAIELSTVELEERIAPRGGLVDDLEV